MDDKLSRKDFLKGAGTAAAAASLFPAELVTAQERPPGGPMRKELLAQCPYCGVGCGTVIQVEGDTIVGMVPDKEHPTNKGVQCIKGLNANEPIYKDRLEYCLVRKDMSDPLRGHVSETKGRFDDSVFRRHLRGGRAHRAERTAEIVKARAATPWLGSGQLTMGRGGSRTS